MLLNRWVRTQPDARPDPQSAWPRHDYTRSALAACITSRMLAIPLRIYLLRDGGFLKPHHRSCLATAGMEHVLTRAVGLDTAVTARRWAARPGETCSRW